ncbi:hypothetical protein KIW84_013584 [Lathyrus oleraceus]|uniref:Reverse transcriptase zinc-binding domain-containing protein n=1 Tax=Pisum sativum TaxID=3888 RepID=A0A9D5BKT3_PEA|nr:hypothetical protein KIW84_013584 [Pisum sativum]
MEAKVQDTTEEDRSGVFRTLWKVAVPTNIKVFGWRLFLNQLATKDQLIKRGLCLTGHDVLCVLCLQLDKDLNQLFFGCLVSKIVWEQVGSWTRFYVSVIGPFWKFFLSWSSFFKTISSKDNIGIIWLAVIWGLWKSRNDDIFNEASCNLNNIVCLFIVPYPSIPHFSFAISTTTYVDEDSVDVVNIVGVVTQGDTREAISADFYARVMNEDVLYGANGVEKRLSPLVNLLFGK